MKRRSLFSIALGAPLARAGSQLAAPDPRSAPPQPEFDLLLKGGRVIDAARSLDGIRDVAISGGLIAAVASDIPASSARRALDVRGHLVVPGLVDIHVHGFAGVSHAGIDLDPFCIARGVTTAIDAGTSGADSFEGFRRHVIRSCATRVLAFLNIARIGLISPLGELVDSRMIDRAAALRTAREYADDIVGIKVRCSHFYSGPNDLAAVKAAREVADTIGKPVMIHVGWPHTPMEEILKQARRGDIITHAFRGAGEGGVIGEDGHVAPYIRRAAEQGILFDVGHGGGSFSFVAAEAALREDFLPSTISSDIHATSVLGPAFDLLTTMSKFLLLGVPLAKVIELATLAPACAVGLAKTAGSLEPVRPADIAVLDLVKGSFPLVDSKKTVRTAEVKLVPVLTLREGRGSPASRA